MKQILILLILCTPVLAQSRDSLKNRYGEPISETFLIRPGIIVTASYSPTGRTTELVVSPQNTDIIKSRGKTLGRDTVKTILAELVPLSERGKLTGTAFINIICSANDCWGFAEDYEKVNIYYSAGKDGGINYAVLQWRQ